MMIDYDRWALKILTTKAHMVGLGITNGRSLCCWLYNPHTKSNTSSAKTLSNLNYGRCQPHLLASKIEFAKRNFEFLLEYFLCMILYACILLLETSFQEVILTNYRHNLDLFMKYFFGWVIAQVPQSSRFSSNNLNSKIICFKRRIFDIHTWIITKGRHVSRNQHKYVTINETTICVF